ncbi:Hypothetical predicted protein [Cloeon dipterum]|uniref:PNPLA domain-containing protein n=1 Tax=Cloeon dipterum TaxID=197152 RepID=A0A8S1CWG0_9INSE|nr:Hypothetical predicted protein [Cloeon dipterum]
MASGRINLSFAGCGFLGIYHVGVAACLKKYAPQLLLNKISGASAGAIAGCCLLCNVPLCEITNDVLRVVSEARSRTLGPFSPTFNVQNILLEGLCKVLPDNAHEMCSGKLFISLTRAHDGKNVIVSEFSSKEELIQAVSASSYIPLVFGPIPKFRGVRYMDGGFTNNQPIFDQIFTDSTERTATVSPFIGMSDICPINPNQYWLSWLNFSICVNLANTSIELSRQNLLRAMRILLPPNPQVLSEMCKQGFDDALRFLHRNNLINCTRCLSVQSTFTISETLDESLLDFDPQCSECKLQRQESMVADLPDTVMTIFQEAIETANKGLVNWVFKHRESKILSILSLPCVLPVEIAYQTFNKFLQTAPLVGKNLKQLSQYILDNLNHIINSLNNKTKQLSAKISCNLAITEYRGTKFDVEADSAVPTPVQNQMNFNFTLNLDDKEILVDQPTAVNFSNQILDQASRRSSSISTANNLQNDPSAIAEDTFEHILQVTAHNDALMAFYYLDENNKVKVTEIFDVTDADTAGLLDPDERNTNLNLEFDDRDWLNGTSWDDECEDDQLSALGDDELNSILEDNSNIFSDPESEWQPNSPTTQADKRPDLRPESDQITAVSP